MQDDELTREELEEVVRKLRARLEEVEGTLAGRRQSRSRFSAMWMTFLIVLFFLISGALVFTVVALLAPPRLPGQGGITLGSKSPDSSTVSQTSAALPTPNPAKADSSKRMAAEPGVPGASPSIKHPLDGRAACLACHGEDRTMPVPDSHAGRTNDTCMECHKQGNVRVVSDAPAIGGAPPAPADHKGRTNDSCRNCHDPP